MGELDVREVEPESLELAAALDHRATPLPERAPGPRALRLVADRSVEGAAFSSMRPSVKRQGYAAIGGGADPPCGLPAARRSLSAQAIASTARIASLARHHWQIASITATWITIR